MERPCHPSASPSVPERPRAPVRAFCVRRRLIERHCERALSSKWRSKTVRSDPCRAKRAPESFREIPVERNAPQGHSERPLSSGTRPRAIPSDPCEKYGVPNGPSWTLYLSSRGVRFLHFTEAFWHLRTLDGEREGASGRGNGAPLSSLSVPERP